MQYLQRGLSPRPFWMLRCFNSNHLPKIAMFLTPICSTLSPCFPLCRALTMSEPNKQDADGNTALHLAVERSSSSCVEALIKHGASMRLRNAIGILPCDVASHKIRKDMLENPAGLECRSMVLCVQLHLSLILYFLLQISCCVYIFVTHFMFLLQVPCHVLPPRNARRTSGEPRKN